MARTLAAVGGFILAIPLGLAAPGGKDAADPPPYFPTAVGTTAVYQADAGRLSMESTDKVTEVTKTPDGVRVTVERSSESGFRPATFETDVTAKGLAQVRFGRRANDPPMPLLRLPAKAGDAWEWEDRAAGRKIQFKVVGEEEVTVPAGKFKAIRVAEEETVRGQTTRHESWYAPKVGLVKRVTPLVVGEQVIVLKSFTAGKD
jgi:hypothetical protein